jgi:hypothetical protein
MLQRPERGDSTAAGERSHGGRRDVFVALGGGVIAWIV